MSERRAISHPNSIPLPLPFHHHRTVITCTRAGYNCPFFFFCLILQLSPGEKSMMDIQGFDELNHMVFTIATISQTANPGLSNRLHVDESIRLLSPLNEVSFPFSYRLANKTVYMQLTNKTLHRFQVEDIFSTLKNRYFFNVTAIPCRPGFKFQGTVCTCDKSIDGVSR